MKVGKAAIAILSVCMLVSGVGFAQSRSPKPVVEDFLSTWLVRKDITKTRKAFARRAFTNKFILSEACGGFVDDKDRLRVKTVETKAIALLKYISLNAKGKTLKEILKHRKLEGVIKGKVLASLETDGYALLQDTNLGLEEKNWKYLKSIFPAKSYAGLLLIVMVTDKDGVSEMPFYFIWARHKGSWRIIHFGMQCS